MNEVAYTAPPTGANLGPGFDVLGVAYSHIKGDKVIAKKTTEFKGVRLVEVKGRYGHLLSGENLVVGVGNKVLEAANADFGVEVILEKNMRLGTGMGSSASSSVSSAMSVNDLLDNPFQRDHPKILEAVVYGEQLATGSRHADNVFPSLLGGFVFISDLNNYSFSRFDGTNNFYFVVASPTNVRVDTMEARRLLNDKEKVPYDLGAMVRISADVMKQRISQNSRTNFPQSYSRLVLKEGSEEYVDDYLKGAIFLIEGIMSDKPTWFGRGTELDKIIAPVRAKLIPGYTDVQEAAYVAGAEGFSISGSGPTVFAVTNSIEKAHDISLKMEKAFKRHGVQTEVYISQPDNIGAQRI